MDQKPVVLVGAQEVVVRRLVAAALQPAGFSVVASDIEMMLGRASDTHPDVLIVEATEPQTSTCDLIRYLRAELSTPILLISALGSPTRVAPALDAGADDYVARPFAPSELAARVRALVRRRGGRLRAGLRTIGGAAVDLTARTVSVDAGTAVLTRAEWTLLTTLMANEGRVMFWDELLAAAFGPDHRGDRALIQLAVGRLRRKLGLGAWDQGPIRTVRGSGYAYDPGDAMRRQSGRSVELQPVAPRSQTPSAR